MSKGFTRKQQRILLEYLLRAYPNEWEDHIQAYKDKGLIKSDKSFENLDIGDPNLDWCKRCGIRRISHPDRKICMHCGKIGGTPLRDDYRCVYIYRKASNGIDPGGRCNRAAVTGSKYCKRHNGNNKKGFGKFKKIYTRGRTIKVPMWYDRVLGNTLLSAVQEMDTESAKTLYEIGEELKLARLAAHPTIFQYSKAYEWYEEHGVKLERYIIETESLLKNGTLVGEEAEKAKVYIQEAKTNLNNAQNKLLRASGALQSAMQNVGAIADRGSTIHERHAKTVEVEQLQIFVSQLVQIIYEELADNEELARRIEHRFHRDVRVPGVEDNSGREVATLRVDEVIQNAVKTMGFLEEHQL